MLVNAKGDILYIHGRTGLYLEPASGEACIANVLKMAREGLRNELSIALRKAVASNETVRCSGLQVKTNGDFTTVNLTISPLAFRNKSLENVSDSTAEATLFIVIPGASSGFRQRSLSQKDASDNIKGISELADKAADENIAALRQELQAKEEYLQAAIEELGNYQRRTEILQ